MLVYYIIMGVYCNIMGSDMEDLTCCDEGHEATTTFTIK